MRSTKNKSRRTAVKKPAFIVYSVIEKPNATKPYFHAVGAAWPNKKGDGFNIQLDSLPLDRNLTMLPPKPDEE